MKQKSLSLLSVLKAPYDLKIQESEDPIGSISSLSSDYDLLIHFWFSSAATGGENGFRIRVYGSKGAIDWFQDDPNILKYTPINKPTQLISRASNSVSDLSINSSRVAAGHPEGFFEAFANIYTEFAEAILAKRNDNNYVPTIPNVKDGVEGIKFIFAAKNSSNQNSKWIKIW